MMMRRMRTKETRLRSKGKKGDDFILPIASECWNFQLSGDDEGDIYNHEKENEQVTDARGPRERNNSIDKATSLGGRLQDQDHSIHV